MSLFFGYGEVEALEGLVDDGPGESAAYGLRWRQERVPSFCEEVVVAEFEAAEGGDGDAVNEDTAGGIIVGGVGRRGIEGVVFYIDHATVYLPAMMAGCDFDGGEAAGSANRGCFISSFFTGNE